MSLSVKSRVEDNFAILDLAGSLTLGPTLTTLRQVAKDALGNGKLIGMILRVGEVTSTDSAGLGELTIVYTFASRLGCPVRLVGATPSLRKMLEMTRLDELLLAADDATSAKRQMKG